MEINNQNLVFIHSCYKKEYGLTILLHLLYTILNSDLIKRTEHIFICNIGDKLTHDMLPQNYKIMIINYSLQTDRYELETINILHTFCQNHTNKCNILYIHTKGMSHNQQYQEITDWTNMMLYFLVEKCDTCIDLLRTHDAVGCNHMLTPHSHFGGNFWWATGEYIKTLDKIPPTAVKHDAEWWILSKPDVKYSCIHQSNTNHYFHPYPRHIYST
jgi:hypothetical protein